MPLTYCDRTADMRRSTSGSEHSRSLGPIRTMGPAYHRQQLREGGGGLTSTVVCGYRIRLRDRYSPYFSLTSRMCSQNRPLDCFRISHSDEKPASVGPGMWRRRRQTQMVRAMNQATTSAAAAMETPAELMPEPWDMVPWTERPYSVIARACRMYGKDEMRRNELPGRMGCPFEPRQK